MSDWWLLCFVRVMRVLLETVSRGVFAVLHRSHTTTPLPPITNLLLLEPATALAAKIRDKKVSSEAVVQAFISRVKAINGILNCMVDERFNLALQEAREVDEYLKTTTLSTAELAQQKPFLGVPFSTKDCFKVKGLRQTAGLYARRDIVAESHADAVRLMVEAGAVILCVTNVSELCMWWESSNTIYGITNNAYDTSRIVGGSSGGEGCLQSACGSGLGVGSDIGGSIRMPAFFNGVFGHKPSAGVVSNSGQEPVAVGVLQEMLGTGPICRHACDLRPALAVLASANKALLQLNKKVDMRSLRVYYIEDDGGSAFTTPVCAEMRAAMLAVVAHLQHTHGITAIKLTLKELKVMTQMYLAKLGSAEEAATFGQELVMKEGTVECGKELLKWLFGRSKHTLPGLGLSLLETILDRKDPRAVGLIAKADALRTHLKELLGEDGVLLYPPHPTTAPYHHQPLCRIFNFAYTAFFNVVGLPVTQCPLGLSASGLPLGIQVAANHYQDHLCLAVAEDLEKAFGGWVCPSTTAD